MYSLKLQLLTATLIAALGSVASFLYYSSPLAAISGVIVSITVSAGILYLFVYVPLQKIQEVITAQEDKESRHRVMVHSSDELQHLSDSINIMLDSFREDIVQMKKLEGVRTEFLGNVSHELRTPIFATQGLIETLLNGAIDDKKVNKDFLQRAFNNIERLNSLLGDLIDISRIESGEMKLRFRFFDVVEFLQNIVDEMQSMIKENNVTLSLIGSGANSIDVYGDKERLTQVLMNLIGNAFKYSERNAAIIIRYLEKNDRVEISVEDTGIGIAPQHLPRIFERFYRVDKDRSREVGGTGLGLAIVKHIVEAHKSTITVHSEVGVGTKFSFFVKK